MPHLKVIVTSLEEGKLSSDEHKQNDTNGEHIHGRSFICAFFEQLGRHVCNRAHLCVELTLVCVLK